MEIPKVQKRYQNIFLLEQWSDYSPEQIKKAFSTEKICVCDFYVRGCENGTLLEWGGMEFERLLLVDHHAPLKEYSRPVSSTHFAENFVKVNGKLSSDFVIAINHTDADSILSSLLMAGLILPAEFLGEAALAADHTGEQNPLADALQALEEERNLDLIVDIAQKIISRRYLERESIAKLVRENRFSWDGDIAWIILKHKVDGGFFPAFFPEARVILSAFPMPPGSPKKWRINFRVGRNVQDIELNRLGLPDFGGRWNAGSTKRSGGTDIEPADYVRIIREKLKGISSGSF